MTPTYPAPTKALSVNYTVDGTNFAIADEDGDGLEPEDIWRLARGVEDHTHDSERGLPVRRIDAVSAPAAPGHVQVAGDSFRWWGGATSQVLEAVSNGTDQTIDGIKRFEDPMLLPRQVTVPPAPGTGLGYLYLGPNDRLYLRSGTNAPAPVGTPGLMAPPLAWQTTQAVGQPLVQQITLGGDLVWVLLYRPAGNDQATLTTQAPFNYGGTPIACYVTWTCGAGVGKVDWTLLAKVTPPDAGFTAAWTQVAQLASDAPDTVDFRHKRATLQWTTGLPAAGDVITFALKRSDVNEAAAGAKFGAQTFLINAGLVFG